MQSRSNKAKPSRKAPRRSPPASAPKHPSRTLPKQIRKHHPSLSVTVEPSPAAQTPESPASARGNKGRAGRAAARALASSPLRSEAPAKKKGAAKKREPKTVRFAPGPLRAPAGGPDGHPTAEGRVAKPVRFLDGGFARGKNVTKKDVRELEQPELLGNAQYEHSITKLKARVGLLPATAPSRPFACNPKGSGSRGKRRSADSGGADAAAGVEAGGTGGGERGDHGKRRRGTA